MALAAHEPTDMAQVLAAEAALRRFLPRAIGVGRGFVFEKPFICMIAASKIGKDLLMRWTRWQVCDPASLGRFRTGCHGKHYRATGRFCASQRQNPVTLPRGRSGSAAAETERRSSGQLWRPSNCPCG
jgi:hypothetical protein